MSAISKPLFLGLIAGAFTVATPILLDTADEISLAGAGVGSFVIVTALALSFINQAGNESDEVVETLNREIERLKKEGKSREKSTDEFKTKLVESTSLRRALSSIARLTVQSLEVNRVLQQVMDSLTSAPIRARKVALWLLNENQVVLESAKGYGGEMVPGVTQAGEIVTKVAASGKMIDSENAGRDPALASITRLRPKGFICTPLIHNREVLGVIDIEELGKEKESIRDDVDSVEFVASLTAMVVKNGRMFAEAKLRATTDGLTKLFNHRHFQDLFDEELARAGRYGDYVSVLITDIDHFKKFNDTYGHQIGDLVLVETAAVFKRVAREDDVVARYGGEEFAIVLPNTNKEEAVRVADDVRRAVESNIYKSEKGDLRVTVSIGVSSFPDDSQDKNLLIKAADTALYVAKESGRNKVCAAGEPAQKAASAS